MSRVSVALRPTPTTSNWGIHDHFKGITRLAAWLDCNIRTTATLRNNGFMPRVLFLPLALAPVLAAAPVNFSEHIAPIVYSRCGGCHRPGESGPFPLTSYQEVSKRGRLIASVTAARYMPPWHAQPAAAPYRDERRLTDGEIALIQEW